MLKMSASEIEMMEAEYPGIAKSIAAFEEETLPTCPRCQSNDTARVQVGVVGRSMHIAMATTKFKLVPNAASGHHFCNACSAHFDSPS